MKVYWSTSPRIHKKFRDGPPPDIPSSPLLLAWVYLVCRASFDPTNHQVVISWQLCSSFHLSVQDIDSLRSDDKTTASVIGGIQGTSQELCRMVWLESPLAQHRENQRAGGWLPAQEEPPATCFHKRQWQRGGTEESCKLSHPLYTELMQLSYRLIQQAPGWMGCCFIPSPPLQLPKPPFSTDRGLNHTLHCHKDL